MQTYLAGTALAAALSLTLGAQQATDQWPQFLGPGSLAHAQGASTLSFDRDQDPVYRVEIPAGESSPCIWDDQIFLTGVAGNELVEFEERIFARPSSTE